MEDKGRMDGRQRKEGWKMMKEGWKERKMKEGRIVDEGRMDGL
jgi:hypothetical protein